MTIRHVRDETGDYTYDTETRKWTKLMNNNDNDSDNDNDRGRIIDSSINVDLSNKMFQNPPGFTTELSSNPNYWRLGRRG